MANLKVGSSGSDVEKLQQALIKAGYDVGKAGADGVYGSKTAAAVKQYQKDNGLAVDGIAGNNTMGSLYSTPGLTSLAKGGVLGAQIAAGNTKANSVTAANQGLKAMATGAVTGAKTAAGANNAKAVTAANQGLKSLAQGSVASAQVAAGAPVTAINTQSKKDKDPIKEVNLDETETGSPKTEIKEPAEEEPVAGTPNVEVPSFSYNPYAQSDIVQEAWDVLNQHNASAPTYSSQWQAQIQEYLNKIMNRDPFSYNFNDDALYQQYKDIYTQMGLMAMMDTMGQASAMTGGYGNSYAQTVGQQAYNQQLSQLNDVLPELYQMAYDRYAYEGDQLYQQYGLLMDQENMDYNRYMDKYNQWANTRDYLAGQYNTLYEQDYNTWLDKTGMDWDKYVMDYEIGRDQVGDQKDSRDWLAGMISSTGYDPSDEQLAAAGMTRGEADALRNTYTTSGGNDNGNNPSGYDNGTLTPAKVRKLQEVLGVTVDGKWGENSSSAAGGMTADEAWKAYQNGTLKTNDQANDTVNSYGLTQSRSDEIYAWLEKALTNPNIGPSFDPVKLINGSGFLTSDAERNFAKELLSVLN